MNSGAVATGNQATAAQYNNLRTDMLALGYDQFEAGVGDIAAYKLMYYDTVSATILYADNTAIATSFVLGIALETITAGSQCWVQTAGFVTNGSWTWTPGKKLFLGTSGDIIDEDSINAVLIAGNQVVEIGYAITATKILLRIKNA